MCCAPLAEEGVHSCLLSSAGVRSRTHTPLWFSGGWINLIGFLPDAAASARMELAIEGKGRSARDEGKGPFRLGVIRWDGIEGLCDEPASGDETIGRDMVMAKKVGVSFYKSRKDFER